MVSSCCVALVVVLAVVVAAVFAAWGYVRGLVARWQSAQGPLPSAAVVPDIGYTSYLPARLPDPAGFDPELAAFALRACDSALNRRLGGDPQLPPGLAEEGWAGGHALILRVAGEFVKDKFATGDPAAPPVFVVAVAGTVTYEDVRADFNYRLVDFYGAHVHSGFADTWARVYPAVQAVAAANPRAQFVVTGHSLGAAVASLVAAALGADFPGLALALYAAAPPRTGARDFVGLLARVVANRWHVVNRADVVPTLPLAAAPLASGPDKGGTALYADFDRVVFFDVQAGSLAANHLTASYLCGLGAAPCAAAAWTTPPAAVVFDDGSGKDFGN